MKDSCFSVLLEIRDDLRAIRSALAEKVDPADAARSTLLREIFRFTEGRMFIVLDLMLNAQVDRTSTLAGAITGAIGQVNGKRLGNLLASVEGRSMNGLSVERCKNTRNGMRWKVVERKS